SPASQAVVVSNIGSGTLSGLAIGTITYGSGASAWLSATLNTTTAPATVTLQPTTGSIPIGTYTATVPVTSSAAGVVNSPQNISVNFTIASTDPCLATSYTIGATFNGTLVDTDCNGPSTAQDRFSVTTSSG